MGLKELVGVRIRQARREKNWNQQRLADEVGIGQPTVAAYETGRVNVPLDTIDRIAEVLGKPIAFFTVADFQYTIKAPTTRGERCQMRICRATSLELTPTPNPQSANRNYSASSERKHRENKSHCAF